MRSISTDSKRFNVWRLGTRYASRLAVVCLGCALTLAHAVAQQQTQPIPLLGTRVTDLTNTLDANQRHTLEADLAAFERRKGSQIGVLMVGTTQPEDIAQYSIRVFDSWKLGRKGIDDGVLLIVAKDDRRVRIEVGRGLEGAIPDAAVARIIREYITPKFRTGDFYGGIEAATSALTTLIDGEPLPVLSERTYVDLPPIAVFGFFFIFLVRLFFGGTGLLIRAPAMMSVFGIATWFLTQLAGKSLTYSLVATSAYAFLAFLSALIPSFTEGIAFTKGGGTGGFSNSGFDSNSSDSGSSSSSDSGGSFSGGGGESAGGGASGSW